MYKRFVPLLLLLSLILTTGGVFANWLYAEQSPLSAEQNVNLSFYV